MNGKEAWKIISANLAELVRFRDAHMRHYITGQQTGKPYSEEEVSAEVLAYMALKEYDERHGGK